MRIALLVALGGATGSVLRWLVTQWAQRLTPASSFPWGTLTVNAVGSLAIGALMTLAAERASLSPEMRMLLVTGVLGGFTTFSAYSYETLVLLKDGRCGGVPGSQRGARPRLNTKKRPCGVLPRWAPTRRPLRVHCVDRAATRLTNAVLQAAA